MSYMKDPNMEAARLKIMAVLQEHDLMGVVTMAGKERAGFFQHLSPAWSCVKVDGEGTDKVMVRVKCRREDYPSQAAQEEALSLSVGSLISMSHHLQMLQQAMQSLVQMVGSEVDIKHVMSDRHMQMAACNTARVGDYVENVYKAAGLKGGEKGIIEKVEADGMTVRYPQGLYRHVNFREPVRVAEEAR